MEALINAFSGHGVDERSVISLLGKSKPEHRQYLRKGCRDFFIEDHERSFERWDDHRIKLLKQEFMRFKNAVVFWAMHPWERDARLVNEAFKKEPLKAYAMIIEIACTRSSDELLGARKAYHSLFNRSVEEDVVLHFEGSQRKLLVGLVSAYRYEGPKIKDDVAKSEAKILAEAIKNADVDPIDDGEVIRILTTRSKPHLRAMYKHYEEICGTNLDEAIGFDMMLQATVQCLCTPATYFCKVLDEALRDDAAESTKKALTRVIVTRADTDIQEINEEYQSQYGVSLEERIEHIAKGNYKDFLLVLIGRDDY